MNKIIGIIPARGGSKGIPKKNIVDLCGKHLISYTIEAALASNIDELYVATDDNTIAMFALHYGAKVYRRSAASSTDEAASEDVLLEVCGHHQSDILVFLQCTSPFTTTEDINECIEVVIQGKDSAFVATEFHHFLWDKDGNGINHDKSTRLRRQDFSQFLEAGSVYVMKTDGFLKHKHRFFGDVGMHVVPQENVFEIDTMYDLKLAEQIMKIKDFNGN